MTTPYPAQRPLARVRRALPLVVFVGALVLVGLITPAPGGEEPLDPTSAEPSGTLALTLIIERLAVTVDILDRLPTTDPDAILVLEDTLGPSTVEDLEDFVRRGGTLVVADPSGRLTADLRPEGAATIGGLTGTLERECIVPALSDADSVRVSTDALFEMPAEHLSCFRSEDLAWMVIEEIGQGNRVTVGGASFLMNGLIGDADNAVLAASLLAPRRGGRLGVIAPGSGLGQTDEATTLTDLIPQRLRLAVVQLLLAFGVVVLWRLRRVGQPVGESPEVRLAGSELVVAVGNLLQRTGAVPRAAALLRADLHRDLAERFGFAPDSDVAAIAAAVSARTSFSTEEIVALLDGPWLTSEEELVDLAQRTEAVRRATLVGVPAMSGAPGADNR